MKKHLLYRLFTGRRDDLPDAKPEDNTPTFKNFFRIFGRKFWKLISLNLLMLPMVLPILIAAMIYLSAARTAIASTPVLAPVYGASIIDHNPTVSLLLDLFGAPQNVIAYHSVGLYVGIGICALFLLLTFGIMNVGSAYVLRGLVRGDPVFVFSDYFYGIKKNWKQGTLLGALDFIVLLLLTFDIWFFYGQIGSFWNNVLFYAACAIAVLYMLMRFYLYLLQITFKLSIRKILKNALIFTTLGIKRNLMAMLGVGLLIGINALLIFAFSAINVVIPLVLPVLYFLPVTAFITTYAAYPVIDRYMIEPFRTPEEKEEPEGSSESGE